MGLKGRGRSGTSRESNPACLCCSSAHLVQCEPDEASSFTNPNVGPGTYASLRLKLDAWSSAVQRGQKCSSPTLRLPSRSWGPIRPRVCSWFRAPIRHECQTAQLKGRGRAVYLSLTPTRHDLTQGQKPEGQIKWAIVPFPGPRSGPKSRTGPGALAKSVPSICRCLPPDTT